MGGMFRWSKCGLKLSGTPQLGNATVQS
jgi:hypothetical protein